MVDGKIKAMALIGLLGLLGFLAYLTMTMEPSEMKPGQITLKEIEKVKV